MTAKFAVRYMSARDRELNQIETALFWWHDEDKFAYAEAPHTLYDTREAAEGGILWIICRKGPHYFGELEVVEIPCPDQAVVCRD